MWFWISLDYATFAVRVSGGGLITEAAPIAGWAIGRDQETVFSYYRRRGAVIRRMVQ